MENKRFILDQTTIKKLMTIFNLKIPDFQRNFVWKKEKKQKLLDSLFRGFPIGAITLYEDGQAYYIIDGLQRINTLNQYLSSPDKVIRFREFFSKVEADVEKLLERGGLTAESAKIRKCLEKWYRGLQSLYEYEKVSTLYHALSSEGGKVAEVFQDFRLVEELSDILKSKIEISNDDIALIIYRGDKENLPDLFRNINTGSVALSQYEILQAVWSNYFLDENLLRNTYLAYNQELELINQDYEIHNGREQGRFDIFKNLTGLNHMICCRENCECLFKPATFKKLQKPLALSDGTMKYYDNDGIAFELYSVVLCGAPNRIVRAVDEIFQSEHDERAINRFVADLNRIICEAVDTAIEHIVAMNQELQDSKYHSLYVLAGIIFAGYDVDLRELTIQKTAVNHKVLNESLDLNKHRKNHWFVDENRQIGFFNIKIEELLELKKNRSYADDGDDDGEENRDGLIEIMINDDHIRAYTVKEFYRKIFNYLSEHGIHYESYVPYATGRKRYLINTKSFHINNSPFVSPIKVKNYYVETNKSKTGAVRDIYRFLEQIGVRVRYVMNM